MASDLTETGQIVRHGPHSWVQHPRPYPAVSVNHTATGCRRPPTALPGLDATNELSVALWVQHLTAPAAKWTQTLSITAFYEDLLVGSIQPHLASVDHRQTSDPAAPHLVSIDRRLTGPSSLTPPLTAALLTASRACHPPTNAM